MKKIEKISIRKRKPWFTDILEINNYSFITDWVH